MPRSGAQSRLDPARYRPVVTVVGLGDLEDVDHIRGSMRRGLSVGCGLKAMSGGSWGLGTSGTSLAAIWSPVPPCSGEISTGGDHLVSGEVGGFRAYWRWCEE